MINIKKAKRLKRRHKTQLLWSANYTPVRAPGFLIEFQYNRSGRFFYAQIAERETPRSPWKRHRDATPEQVAYLRSLLTPAELAECMAASITFKPISVQLSLNGTPVGQPAPSL